MQKAFLQSCWSTSVHAFIGGLVLPHGELAITPVIGTLLVSA